MKLADKKPSQAIGQAQRVSGPDGRAIANILLSDELGYSNEGEAIFCLEVSSV